MSDKWKTKVDKQQVKSEKLVAHKLNTKIDERQTKKTAAKTMNGKNHIQWSDQFSDEINSAMSEKNHEKCRERMFVYSYISDWLFWFTKITGVIMNY